MTPQKGEPVQVHISLHSESLELPEESLAKVERHLPAQDLVPEQDAETDDIGAVAGEVDYLAAVALLLVTLDSEPLQPRSHHHQQAADVLKLHGDQIELD